MTDNTKYKLNPLLEVGDIITYGGADLPPIRTIRPTDSGCRILYFEGEARSLVLGANYSTVVRVPEPPKFLPKRGDVIDIKSVRGILQSLFGGEVVVAVTARHVCTAYVSGGFEPDHGDFDDDYIDVDYYPIEDYVFSIYEETP